MLVVSDSSPINFLVRLRLVEVLPSLFDTVLIPPTVEFELSRPNTPLEVRQFISSKPAWLSVRAPATVEHIAKLDPGEEAAISLAQEAKADLILLDDGDARKAATVRGLAVIGLIGVLERGDERKLLDLTEVATRLPADYRIDSAIVAAAVQRREQRRLDP